MARHSTKRACGGRGIGPIGRLAVAATLLTLTGCVQPKVTKTSSSGVTVRYGGMFATLDKATDLARKSCAAYHKRARLRTVSFERFGGGERWAHFACLPN